MNRHLKIAFTVSLLLNVFFLGVCASWGYRHVLEKPAAVRPLRPELSHDIAKAMVTARRDHETLHQELKKARQAMNGVLAAGDFSEENFRRAAQNIDRAQQALYKARTESMLKMAKEMSSEDRQQMARQMQAMSERRGGNGENLDKFRDRLKERRGQWRDAPPDAGVLPPEQ